MAVTGQAERRAAVAPAKPQTDPAPGTKRKRSGPGIVGVVVFLLLAVPTGVSAAWYIVPEVREFARNLPVVGPLLPTEVAESPAPDPKVELEKRVKELEAALQERTLQAAEQERALNAAQETIAARDETIEKLRAELAAAVKSAASAEKNRQRVAKLYETMDPAVAGLLLSMLPRQEAAQLLLVMTDRGAAAILAAMEPTVAVQMLREISR